MGKHLEFDEKVKKEFGIDKSLELDDTFKTAYVRSQFAEIRKAAYRERIDLLIANYQLEKATDENVKAQWNNKVAEKRLMLKQFTQSLQALKELGDELGINVAE